MNRLPTTIDDYREIYRSGQSTPAQLLRTLRERASADDHNCWIHLLDSEELEQQLARLATQNAELPLYGIPFAIKDNIDLAGIPTTAACADFSYVPEQSATLVQRLIDLGAVPMGKTNLDQFATGLNGTRSPWGACHNALNPDYVSGGSSSGSAVATALGYVCFALGTDTAGSGRVPAMFNSLYGVKPTRGLLSNRGMVPACASLDCVSLFAKSLRDAETLFDLTAEYDPLDPWSRQNPFENRLHGRCTIKGKFRIGIPQQDQLEFFGDSSAAGAFDKAIEKLTLAGGEPIEVDFSCFFDAAKLLYEGPWIAERYLAIRELMETSPDSLNPTVRGLIEPASEMDALSVFDAMYQLQACRSRAEQVLQQVDLLVTPTAPRCYRIEEMLGDPVRLNSNLGYYTNFMNLLDMAALAIPTGTLENGTGFGITLFHRAFEDQRLLQLASRLEPDSGLEPGYANQPGTLLLAVCGAHLQGQPLNWQLTERQAKLVACTTTAAGYRLFDLNEPEVKRPALVQDPTSDQSIEIEVWQLPTQYLGSFLQGIAPPLGLGSIQLANGSWVKGFICEQNGLEQANDITRFGSWRNYLEEKQTGFS